MDPNYAHPVAVSHRGLTILFAVTREVTPTALAYNILNPTLESSNDVNDWTGYHPLVIPEEVCPAGMSLARVATRPETSGLIYALSDQQYVYLFRTAKTSIFVNRYRLVEIPSPQPKGLSSFELQPAWEVRYRYSGNADVPASDKDPLSPKDSNGLPFIEPVLELPFAHQGLDLTQATLTVLLESTAKEGELRWQFFLPNPATGRLLTFSVARSEDGWFAFDPGQLDPETFAIRPDVEIALLKDGNPLAVDGHLTSVNYVKQEPMLSGNTPVLKLKRTIRALLVAPVTQGTTRGLASLDFAVGVDGRLAGLSPSKQALTYEVGLVQPAPSVLTFDTVSAVRIGDPLLVLPQTFSLEAWVYPSATTLDMQILMGGDPETPDPEKPPTLWIQDGVRVGVGFGEAQSQLWVASVTQDNVLTLNSWNHVAATHDGTGFAIYINGHPAKLQGSEVAGATPASNPVTALGAQCRFIQEQTLGEEMVPSAANLAKGFEGLLDEVRIWSKCLTQEAINAYLFKVIPEAEAKQDLALAAYWRLDEGGGGVANDLSSYGRTGHLAGPAWVHTSSPLAQEDGERPYFDPQGLCTYVGLIRPHPDHPRFGALAAGTRPWLLDGADGLVHLYYSSEPDKAFSVIQYDATIERAYYAFPWIARGLDAGTTQQGSLYLLARQSGVVLNQATLTVAAGGNPNLAQWSLNDGLGTIETWSGLPRKCSSAIQILTGQATSQPTAPGVSLGTLPFYDYAGVRPMAVVPAGDPTALGALWFLSAQTAGFRLNRAVFAAGPGPSGDLTLTFASDLDHPTETLVKTLRNVPTEAAALVATVSGGNASFDYGGAHPGNADAYAIPGTPLPITVFIPDTAGVQEAQFSVSPALQQDPLRCDFKARLRIGQDPWLEAVWPGLERQSQAFIAALLASTEPQQKDIVSRLRFLDPHSAVQDGATAAKGDLHAFLALLSVVNDGVVGAVGSFDAATAICQGARSTRASAKLELGSNLFSVAPFTPPSNGYPAAMDLGAGQTSAVLYKPGKDGGWTPEPPRTAIRIHNMGDLAVNAEAPAIKHLAITGDFTLESWAKVLEVEPQSDTYYPRILHANLSAHPTSPRYFLGLAAGHALQFQSETAVTTSDASVADAGRKLFPGIAYTVQLYLRPDLSTPDGSNTIYQRSTTQGTETLTIDKAGNLQLAVADSARKVVAHGPRAMTSQIWQMITVTRTAQEVVVYLNGDPGAGVASPPSLGSSPSTLVVGGNSAAQALQMEMNQFAVWSKSFTAKEIAARFMTSIAMDDAGLQLLWAMDDDTQDKRIPNSAVATQGLYDSVAKGNLTFWDYPGLFYRAFCVSRDSAIQSAPSVAAFGEWHHYAVTYRCQTGIQLDGVNSANCGNDSSLNLQSGLSLEAWVWPGRATGSRQAVISKMGSAFTNRSYELGLDAAGRPYLTVRLDGATAPGGGPAPERLCSQSFTAANALADGQGHYLVATASIVGVADKATNQQVNTLAAQLYVDGIPQIQGPEMIGPAPNDGATYYTATVLGGQGSGRYKSGATVTLVANDAALFLGWRGNIEITDAKNLRASFAMPNRDVTVCAVGMTAGLSITASDVALNLGRALTGGNDNQPAAPFTGGMAEVRVWSRAIDPGSIQQAFLSRTPPSSSEGLISAWSFKEQAGTVAFDGYASNNAVLTSSSLWSTYHDGARMELLVDGHPIATTSINPGHFGSYGPDQVRFGADLDSNGAYRNPFLGVIDEIRVWNTCRTHEEITDNMNRYLMGFEPHLAGYWCFDAGSGNLVADATGKGNNAIFDDVAEDPSTRPEWVTSDAPISNEAPPVENALGGLGYTAPFVATLDEGPSVFEYADTETDVEGIPFSVMKRGYAYVSSETLRNWIGYKVGDLQRVYIGQVQTRPSLMGYIEGPPPIPSENLTRPFYKDPVGSYFQYDGVTSITLTENQSTSVSFSASRVDRSGFEASFKGGVNNDQVVLVDSTPPVNFAYLQEGQWAWKVGVGGSTTLALSETNTQGLSAEYAKAISHTLSSGGEWEPVGQIYLKSGERRYLPANEGYAVVKSATADMYGLFLGTTGALVRLSVVPNPDIPEDVNLLYFPIDPSYVHNGSLDGRVGLQADPLSAGQPSYYRPAEAYTLARKIERQNAQLEAWYTQYNAVQKGRSQDTSLAGLTSSNPFYDWAVKTPRKDMLCKYVWTAGGGLYKEQESYSSVRQESHGGAFEFDWRVGGVGELSFSVGPVGLFFELEVAGGMGWTVEVEKAKEESSALEMDVDLNPEGCLLKYLNRDEEPFYSKAPVPGKVDTYRFATFYLAPTLGNTDFFFNHLIDSTWLATSQEPRAAALREAMGVSQGKASWCVKHRVTYVSRIPPEFQPVPTESAAPPLADCTNLDGNTYILELVQQHLGQGQFHPTPVQLSAAIQQVLLTDLKNVIPWWADFLLQAEKPNTPEAEGLQGIIEDANQYLTTHYQALGSLG